MKNTTIISIHRLPYAAILAFLVQNPPVAIVENELHTASNQLIHAIRSNTVSTNVRPT